MLFTISMIYIISNSVVMFFFPSCIVAVFLISDVILFITPYSMFSVAIFFDFKELKLEVI